MKLQVDDMELQDDRDPTRYRVSLDIPQITGGGEFQVNVLVNDSTLALVDIRVDERGLVRLRTKCCWTPSSRMARGPKAARNPRWRARVFPVDAGD